MSEEIRRQLTELNRLLKEEDEIYAKIAAGAGYSESEIMMLYALCEADHPCTQKELSDMWSLKKQTVHFALKKLCEGGYVRMEPLPQSARIKLVLLTEEGEKLLERTILPLMKAEENVLASFTEKEREQLMTLNQKYIKMLQKEADRLVEWYHAQRKSVPQEEKEKDRSIEE